MTTLPPIYWINLDRAHERRTRMFARFSGRGLAETRVSAVDGRAVDTLSEFVTWPGAHPLEAARVASHLRAVARAYADGVPWALVMEDETTFELFDVWVDGFGAIERALPTSFGMLSLSLSGAPRELDRIFRRAELVLPVAGRDIRALGAYVIGRDAMAGVLDRYARDGRCDLSSLAPADHDACHAIVCSVADMADARGPVLSRIPLFLDEARDNDVHTRRLSERRASRAFILEHHHALLRRTYVSPFTWRARVRAMWVDGH